jgi:H+-translocating NAD(P) transhydrogenase subunit alpha
MTHLLEGDMKSAMHIAVASERAPGERRVAMVPEVATRLISAGHEVAVEAGAGVSAWFGDDDYRQREVTIVADRAALLAGADVLCAVQTPAPDAIALLHPDAAVVSFFQPAEHPEALDALLAGRISSFSLDFLPRISRAQAMDALSSQSTVTGYRAVLEAAVHLPRFFPMFMTAAGTVPPAKVLVLGAGVAGLQAIATARRLGAVVRAHDIRPAAREEVRSLGATFVELGVEAEDGTGGYAREQSTEFLDRQRELIASEVAAADAVITTAAVPGRRAPLLVTTPMVEEMRAGAVVVDLGAESGGNCELSVAGSDVVHGGVTIVGTRDLASSMPAHASFLYARNIAEFVGLLARGADGPDFSDEIIAGTCITHGGQIRHQATADMRAGSPQ